MGMVLTQPLIGSTGWGAAVNANFQTVQDFANAVGNQVVVAPGAPVVGQLWVDSSLPVDYQHVWQWDGARWVSAELFVMECQFPVAGAPAPQTLGFWPVLFDSNFAFSLMLLDLVLMSYQTGPCDAGNYRLVQLYSYGIAAGGVLQGQLATWAAGWGPGEFHSSRVALGRVIVVPGNLFQVLFAQMVAGAGAPGLVYGCVRVTVRLVH